MLYFVRYCSHSVCLFLCACFIVVERWLSTYGCHICVPFIGLAHLLHKGYYSDCFILHDESQNNNVDNDYDKHETNNVEGNSYFMMSHSSGNRGLERDERRDLDQTWTRPFKYQPLWKIRNYFGERVAFYFAWSGSLCTTLWLPSIFGIFVFFYGLHERFVIMVVLSAIIS